MKFISPYIFQAFLTCYREAWLEYHSLHADQDNEYLALGRLTHEDAYRRERKEIFVDQLLKIDLFKGDLVAEVKKSSRHIEAARMQLLYYLWYLKKHKGISMEGILLFPGERRTERVTLTSSEENKIENIIKEVEQVLSTPKPPPVQKNRYCRTCAFREFCWA